MITRKEYKELSKALDDERKLGYLDGLESAKELIINALLEEYGERLSDGRRVPSIQNEALDEAIAFIEETLEKEILEGENK
jgi:hypothetical protein